MTDTSQSSKRIAKNTLLLYVRMLFMMAVSLYTSRVVLNTLGVEDFGIYNVVGGFVTMFTFINSAMASATQRYLNFELGTGNMQKLETVFCTSVNIHALISVIILLLAETVGLWFLYTHMTIPPERFSSAVWVYQFAILSTIVMIMSVPYNATIIAHEKMGAFAYISVLEVMLKLLIVYLLVVFDFDKLKLYAVLMFSIQLLIRIFYGNYRKLNFEVTKYRFAWDKGLFKEMTGFAGWNIFGNLAAVAFTQGINVLLNIFFGPAVNAARGVAVQVQNAIKGFCQNFQTAINPQIVKSYASKDYSYMYKLVFTSSKFSFYLLLILSLPVLCETHQILLWWLKIVPEHTVNFIRLILVISMIDALSNPVIQLALSTGKIKKYQIVVGTLLLLIVPVSYAALKMGADPEAVFAVHLSFVVLAQFVRLWMIRPMVNLSLRQYAKKVALPIIFVSVCSVIIPLMIVRNMDENFVRFLIVTLVCVVTSTASIVAVGLTKGERQFAFSKAKALKSKFMR